MVSCFFPPSYADSTEKTQEQKLTQEQKKEIAKQAGIIPTGMTKDEVRETFGLLKPRIWFTYKGQEVWYYKAPEEQNIYFKDDKVERVEYGAKPDKKQPVEL